MELEELNLATTCSIDSAEVFMPSGPHGRAAMVEPLGVSGLAVAAATWPPWAGGAGESGLKETEREVIPEKRA